MTPAEHIARIRAYYDDFAPIGRVSDALALCDAYEALASDLEELVAKAKRAVGELANLFDCMESGACKRDGHIAEFHLDALAVAGNELRAALRLWDGDQ